MPFHHSGLYISSTPSQRDEIPPLHLCSLGRSCCAAFSLRQIGKYIVETLSLVHPPPHPVQPPPWQWLQTAWGSRAGAFQANAASQQPGPSVRRRREGGKLRAESCWSDRHNINCDECYSNMLGNQCAEWRCLDERRSRSHGRWESEHQGLSEAERAVKSPDLLRQDRRCGCLSLTLLFTHFPTHQ